MNASTEGAHEAGGQAQSQDEERIALANPERMFFILLKARQVDDLDEDIENDDEDEGDADELELLDDESDEDEQLEAEADGAAEYLEALQSLSDDERLDLATLLLIGRGDFAVDEWDEARVQAAAMALSQIPSFIVSISEAGDHIEDALSALGYSFDEFEDSLQK